MFHNRSKEVILFQYYFLDLWGESNLLRGRFGSKGFPQRSLGDHGYTVDIVDSWSLSWDPKLLYTHTQPSVYHWKQY